MLSPLLNPLLEFLLNFAVEHLIKQAIKLGPSLARKMRQQVGASRPQPSFVVRTGLVNRERELRTIRAAVQDAPNRRFIYLSGPGGVGKTRLLEETGHLTRKIPVNVPLCWSGVLDLYHADLHNISALQMALIEGLDPEARHFQKYRRALERFESRRTKGLVGPALAIEQEELDNLFLEEYNAFASHRRPVIAFDTLESLSHESDLIQNLCRLEEVPVAVRGWLLQHAPRLKNSIILLAGRPQPLLRQVLEQVHSSEPGRFETIELAGLTREDNRQLLRALLKNASPGVQALRGHADRLWQLTAGRPVHLTLAVELASQSERLVSQSLPEAKNDVVTWGRHLVDALFDYADPGGRIFFFLALARKGLDADLLHYLEPSWPAEECARRLTTVRNLSIVKARPGQEEVFLHDALYELFDMYLPSDEELHPWRERLADYYRAQQSWAGEDRALWAQTTVTLLYYELQLGPRRAFESGYIHWDETAIKGYEVGLDIQLRDELLRFFHSPINQQLAVAQGLTRESVDRDSAVRWVKRFLMQQRRQQAIRVAETILTLGPEPYSKLAPDVATNPAGLSADQQTQAKSLFIQADSFFWGQLLTYYGEALVYTGASEAQTRRILEQAVQLLEVESLAISPSLVWLQKRVLGRANNTLGYLLRAYGHYGGALDAYGHALRYFESADIVDEQADTLNNLAFVLALLGEGEQAKEVIDRALELRRRSGQRYPEALSHNTRGLIYALEGQLELSRRECEWALLTFEELEEFRGIGLACIALGLIFRQQGKKALEKNKAEGQIVELFQQGAKFLERAITIFSEQVKEPIRLWEAHNELGSLFREWGNALRSPENEPDAQEKYEQAVQAHHQALDTAQRHGLRFQEADTCDDLAQVWAASGNMEMARQWLNRTLALMPAEYILNAGQGFRNAPESGEAYWLVLGKAHWQQSLWALRALKQENPKGNQRANLVREAVYHLVMTFAYCERYRAGTAMLRARLRVIAYHFAQVGVAIVEAQMLISEFASEYKVDPIPLLNIVSDPSITDAPPARS